MSRRKTTTSALHYIGPAPVLGIVPLPEGWPASDHEETDDEVRAKKLSSGFYETAVSAASEPAAEE